MRHLILILGSLLSTAASYSQTLSPVVQICVSHKKDAVCSGTFYLRNNLVVPLFVTLEKKSILGANGTMMPSALDTKVELQISASSARISPQATEEFGYKLRCQTYPCAVQIVSSMVVGKTTEGVQVKLSLPELIVACDNGKPEDCRNSFRRMAGVPETK